METGIVVLMVTAALIGLLVGAVIAGHQAKRKEAAGMQGVLNIDCSDPSSSPGLWLQLDVPIEDVTSRERATFVVRVIHYNSHE